MNLIGKLVDNDATPDAIEKGYELQYHNVLFACPVAGDVKAYTTAALFQAGVECTKLGWDTALDLRIGDADLSRARNMLLATFLSHPEFTDIIFVDSDISYGPGVIRQLVEHEPEFVMAAARMRTDDMDQYPVAWPDKKEIILSLTYRGLQPLLKLVYGPFGLVRLKRSVVEKLAANARWMNDVLQPEAKCPWVFDFITDETCRRSEDFIFCKKWLDLGGDIWVDPMIKLHHTGIKTFSGCLYENLQQTAYAFLHSQVPQGGNNVVDNIHNFIGNLDKAA